MLLIFTSMLKFYRQLALPKNSNFLASHTPYPTSGTISRKWHCYCISQSTKDADNPVNQSKHEADAKGGKTCERGTLLIGWESGASYLNQCPSIAIQNIRKLELLSTLEWKTPRYTKLGIAYLLAVLTALTRVTAIWQAIEKLSGFGCTFQHVLGRNT